MYSSINTYTVQAYHRPQSWTPASYIVDVANYMRTKHLAAFHSQRSKTPSAIEDGCTNADTATNLAP